ncbi:MAG: anti-sigma-factor antagonist [Frankiales bacterium]|jgi:anti-anti-sigma factor|nr:anti-sigma-factor antagonist [Frankiales bacterium]
MSVAADSPLAGDPTGCVAQVRVAGRLVHLSGRLDVSAAADVRLLLFDQVQRGAGDLVVDLSALVAVDATGLGVLVGAHRHAGRAGRGLVLRDVPAPVARLLRLTRLDRVLRQARTRLYA